LSQVWACEFFTIVSLRFRVLYGFVMLALERRAIVHVGVTEHPTAEWTAQRVVEAIGDRARRTPSAWRNRPADLAAFSGDDPVAPGRVLAPEPADQCA
jgi:hypothetical protein